MHKGVFAHLVIYGNTSYKKHIVFLTQEENNLTNISPFYGEVAHTIFTDGIVIVASPSLSQELSEFIQLLQREQAKSQRPLNEVISNSDIYRRHIPAMGEPCRLFSVTPIQWETMSAPENSLPSIKEIIF